MINAKIMNITKKCDFNKIDFCFSALKKCTTNRKPNSENFS